MARDYAADISDPVAGEIVSNVGVWVDKEVVPVASDYEHEDAFPQPLVDGMANLGLFGIKVPEAYGGLDLSFECYAGVCMELARGWMSLAGIINTHVLVG
ncbi:MAG: acyl-CoA dehydrogenase family protein, partial [Dehalococcoidia bacterium]|nr:acyl-CoA dehydrogenase family protein [Dehalococcoidia bacterium]